MTRCTPGAERHEASRVYYFSRRCGGVAIRRARAARGRAPSQSATVPLVGFLNSASPDTYRFNADSFREGLAQAGFVEGRNVRIEERWAKSDYQALPGLAAELIAKGVVA